MKWKAYELYALNPESLHYTSFPKQKRFQYEIESVRTLCPESRIVAGHIPAKTKTLSI
jgi:hypothetical protein